MSFRLSLLTTCRRSGAALLLMLLCVVPVSGQDRPGTDQAMDFLQRLVDEAAATLTAGEGSLEAREEGFRELLRVGFDMPYIARIALGKHWPRASDEERATYVDLFSEFVLKSYAPRLGGFRPDQFQVNDAIERGDTDMLVRTSIAQSAGPPINAAWRVRLVEGQPRIVDIVVEGVSMAVNQRNEFNAVVSRNGMTGLLELLRARTERLAVEAPT